MRVGVAHLRARWDACRVSAWWVTGPMAEGHVSSDAVLVFAGRRIVAEAQRNARSRSIAASGHTLITALTQLFTAVHHRIQCHCGRPAPGPRRREQRL
jgi:hypothetical protein